MCTASIFELGSVSKLKADLDEQGIKSKKRISATGEHSGGVSFFPGALYLILQNPIYLGEIRHRDQSYPGEHEAIIPRDLWERVQAKIEKRQSGTKEWHKSELFKHAVWVYFRTTGATDSVPLIP